MRAVIVIAMGFLLLPLLIWAGACTSLDRSQAHTQSARALPLFPDSPREGLVRIAASGMEFRARVAGLDQDGPALVLLHGFPESSIMWSPLIERAAAAGYRVVAYDQRGFSPGARPAEVAAYGPERVAEDVFSIADAVGFDAFHLVGHDWGAMVGWVAVGSRPDRIRSWTSLSIPHPAALRPPDADRSPPAYVHVFRVPGLAEALLGFGGRWVLHRAMWSTMSEADRAEYDALYSEPGALEATLSLYRAMDIAALPREVAQAPALHIYGRNDMDVYVNDGAVGRISDWVGGDFTKKALDAGHWLIQERQSEVVDEVMRHLERHR